MLTTMDKRDTLYAQPLNEIAEFVFDEAVVKAFPDMIQRSVPGYASVLSMLPVFANRFVRPDSHCYDLGCSLGASTLAMRRGVSATNVVIHAVDNAKPMIDACNQLLDKDTGLTPVVLHCQDIREVQITKASMVVLNFTLQFLPIAERDAMIARCLRGILPGGVLILSEKIAFDGVDDQRFFTDVHHDYKRANGYSDQEISQKRDALETVLIPETEEQHLSRLRKAGFSRCVRWFQSLNFVSMLAVK